MTTIHSGSGEVLEVAVLSVQPGEENDFENASRVAQALIAASPGCRGHQLRRSLKVPSQYLLLVRWRTLEDHTIGFRRRRRTWNGNDCFIIFTTPSRP